MLDTDKFIRTNVEFVLLVLGLFIIQTFKIKIKQNGKWREIIIKYGISTFH